MLIWAKYTRTCTQTRAHHTKTREAATDVEHHLNNNTRQNKWKQLFKQHYTAAPCTTEAYWLLPYCQPLPLATDIANHAWIAEHQCNTHSPGSVSPAGESSPSRSYGHYPSHIYPHNSRPFLTFALFAKLPQEMLHPLSWVPGACNQWKRSVRLISVFFSSSYDRGYVIHPTRARTHIPHWSSGRWLDVWIATGCWLVVPMVTGFDWMNGWLGLNVIWWSPQDAVNEQVLLGNCVLTTENYCEKMEMERYEFRRDYNINEFKGYK